jgi:hypothetical protein
MGMRPLSDTVEEVLDHLRRRPQRWPIARLGEREPIPWLLRLSILRRDDYRCKTCGWYDPTGTTLELDHCLPWSAGGPDDSENLRVLCSGCNQRRSNFDDGAERTRRLPTTWWCMSCWSDEPAFRQPWADGTDLSTAPLVRDPLTLAWCAWCWASDYTDQPLTGHYARLVSIQWQPSRSAG